MSLARASEGWFKFLLDDGVNMLHVHVATGKKRRSQQPGKWTSHQLTCTMHSGGTRKIYGLPSWIMLRNAASSCYCLPVLSGHVLFIIASSCLLL